MADREKVIYKEFDENQAGLDVGIVSVKQRETSANGGPGRTISEVALKVTRVGEQGAQCGYTICHDIDDKKVVFGGDTSGFEELTSLSVSLYEGLNVHDALRNGLVLAGKRAKGMEADRVVADYGITDEDEVVLVEGKPAILSDLKDGLASNEMSEFYPLVYYLLNNTLLRAKYGGIVDSAKDRCYSDKEMTEMTETQLLRAVEITSILDAVAIEDKEMLENLTLYSTIKASKVAKAFKKSREQVREYEVAAAEAASQLYIPDLSFLPIGQVSGGRSWPYMDAALPADDPKSFGRELAALEDKNINPVVSELRRELDEVEKRAEYARTASAIFSTLSAQEETPQ